MACRVKHWYGAILPVYLLSALTGTLAFHLSKRKGQYKLEITKTSRSVVLLYLLVFSLCLFDAFVVPENWDIFSILGNVVLNLGLIVQFFGGILIVYITYIHNFVYCKTLRDLLIKCSQVDKNLMQYKDDLKYQSMFYYQVIVIGTDLVVISVTGALQYVSANASGLKATVSFRLMFMFPLVVIFVTEMQYIALCRYLKLRFQYLNKQLKALTMHHPVKRVKHIQVLPALAVYNKPAEFISANPVHRFENFMHVHDLLCDITDDINKYYGLYILATAALKFVTSLFSVFYTYLSYADVRNLMNSPIFWFLWAAYTSSELLILIVSCYQASSEAHLTAKIVHKLIIQTTDNNLKDKLQTFSIQLLQRSVKFTALDVFTIDGSLILSVISAASTYLIIMIQYEQGLRKNESLRNVTQP